MKVAGLEFETQAGLRLVATGWGDEGAAAVVLLHKARAKGVGGVFELDETQLLIQDTARAWCEAELAPQIPVLESGATLLCELLRRLGAKLGVAEGLVPMAERRIARLRSGGPTVPTMPGDRK